MGLEEIILVDLDRIDMVQDKDSLWVVVNTVMNLQVQ